MQINIRLVLIIFLTGVITCSAAGAEEMSDDIVKVKVNNSTFDVKLENNSATEELLNTLKKQNITVEAADYGNFEKVGS